MQLQAGELDAVIGRLPADGPPLGLKAEGLSILPLYSDEVCLVAHPANPLRKIRRMTLRHLTEAEWVLQRPESSVRHALNEVFLREGLSAPLPTVETPTYLQNLAIVAQSLLLSIAPRRAAD